MIIGASSRPTLFKITTPIEQYVRCGADILLNGVEHDLEGEGQCIVCGRAVRVNIVGAQIARVEPPDALLHVVEIRGEHGGPTIVCEGSPIFDRDTCLQIWLKSYRELPGQVFKPQEYMARATRLVADRVRPAQTQRANETSLQGTRVIRCADCDCSPSECAASTSAIDCPNCRLESCCCWISIMN